MVVDETVAAGATVVDCAAVVGAAVAGAAVVSMSAVADSSVLELPQAAPPRIARHMTTATERTVAAWQKTPWGANIANQ